MGLCVCVAQLHLKIHIEFLDLGPLTLLPLVRIVNEKCIALQTRMMVPVARISFRKMFFRSCTVMRIKLCLPDLCLRDHWLGIYHRVAQ